MLLVLYAPCCSLAKPRSVADLSLKGCRPFSEFR